MNRQPATSHGRNARRRARWPEAAGTLRDRAVRDRIRWSRSMMRTGLQPGDAQALDKDISVDARRSATNCVTPSPRSDGLRPTPWGRRSTRRASSRAAWSRSISACASALSAGSRINRGSRDVAHRGRSGQEGQAGGIRSRDSPCTPIGVAPLAVAHLVSSSSRLDLPVNTVFPPGRSHQRRCTFDRPFDRQAAARTSRRRPCRRAGRGGYRRRPRRTPPVRGQRLAGATLETRGEWRRGRRPA